MNAPAGNRLVWAITAAAAILSGAVAIATAPILSRNPLLLVALPAVALLAVVAAANLKALVILVLFARALLDPLLNTTKVAVGGVNAGAGAALNLIVIGSLALLILKRRADFGPRGPVIAWGLFLAVSAVACLYTPLLKQGIKLEVNLVSYFAMFAMPFIVVRTKQDRNFWIGLLLWSTLLPVFLANLDLLRGGSPTKDAGNRIQGTFTHPNILAFYLLFVMALVFYVLRTGYFRLSSAARAALWIYALDLAVLLVASKTRSAWLACWIMVLVYGALCEKKFLFLALLALPIAMLHPEVRARVFDSWRETGIGVRENSFSWRINLWKKSMPAIYEHWLFGNGLASFKTHSVTFVRAGREGPAAHNAYFEVLFESGIAGLAAFIALFVTLWGAASRDFRRLARPLRPAGGILLAFIAAYAVFSFADNLLHYLAFNWYFWFFVGLMIKGNRLEISPQENPVSDHAAALPGGQRR